MTRSVREAARRHLVGAARFAVGARRRTPRGTQGAALTFDDGPDPVSTPRVLDVLAARQVRATFFLVGERAERHPELVRRMRDDGHAVGSHSWSHPIPWTLGVRALRDDYERGHIAVQKALDDDTRLFRPPHGHLGPAGLRAVLQLRLQPVLWSLDPLDYLQESTSEDLVERTKAVADRDVILLHDALVPVRLPGLPPPAQDREATLTALPRILDVLAAAGLPAVPWPRSGRQGRAVGPRRSD